MNYFKLITTAFAILLTQFSLASEVARISQNELISLQNSSEEILLIDTRSTEEFKQGHIEGAINIDVSQIYGRLNEIPKNKRLILYCQSGARANRALRILSAKGYDQLYHLEGDMNAWMKNRKPIVK